MQSESCLEPKRLEDTYQVVGAATGEPATGEALRQQPIEVFGGRLSGPRGGPSEAIDPSDGKRNGLHHFSRPHRASSERSTLARISILPVPDGTLLHPKAAEPTTRSSSHHRPAPELFCAAARAWAAASRYQRTASAASYGTPSPLAYIITHPPGLEPFPGYADPDLDVPKLAVEIDGRPSASATLGTGIPCRRMPPSGIAWCVPAAPSSGRRSRRSPWSPRSMPPRPSSRTGPRAHPRSPSLHRRRLVDPARRRLVRRRPLDHAAQDEVGERRHFVEGWSRARRRAPRARSGSLRSSSPYRVIGPDGRVVAVPLVDFRAIVPLLALLGQPFSVAA